MTPELIRTLCCLSTYGGPTGYAAAPQAVMGERVGLSRPQVNAHLRELERLGYVRSMRRKRPDGGEAEKYYRVMVHYVLAREDYRALPADYGCEPEEDLTPLFPEPDATPPVGLEPTPRARVLIQDFNTGGGIRARAREEDGQELAQVGESAAAAAAANTDEEWSDLAITATAERVRVTARLGDRTPAGELHAQCARWLASGFSPGDLIVAAAACAEWWGARNRSVRLDSLMNWMQRESAARTRAAAAAAEPARARKERREYAQQSRAITASHAVSNGQPILHWNEQRNAWDELTADGATIEHPPEQPPARTYEQLATGCPGDLAGAARDRQAGI